MLLSSVYCTALAITAGSNDGGLQSDGNTGAANADSSSRANGHQAGTSGRDAWQAWNQWRPQVHLCQCVYL